MKRWGLLVAGLYALTLGILALPVTAVCFSGSSDALNVVLEFGWLVILVFAVDQVLLLVVPVALAQGRPVSRRALWLPVALSASLATLLATGFVLCLAFGIGGDEASEGVLLAALSVAGLSWFAWGALFYRYAATRDPEAAVSRMMTWLLRGSILELIVAVPCHVIARRRDDCCAPGVTFLGICTGLAVMLISFGPGVFFLFVRRLRDRRPRVAEIP